MPYLHQQAIEALLQNNTVVRRGVHNYSTLKERVLAEELQREINFLKEAITQDDFETQFRERCRQRQLQNINTALSFSVLPNGSCNTLYWEIGKIVAGEAATMVDMLALLLPNVQSGIVVEESGQAPTRGAPITLHLVAKTLGEIEELRSLPLDLNELGHMVIDGDCLLDVRSIEAFPFRYHEAYYQAITALNSNLATHLYSHNAELQNLKYILERPTPRQAITTLMHGLRQGGMRVGYSLEAAGPEGYHARDNFQRYLDRLPVAMNAAVLSLKGGIASKTLGNVMNELALGGCVQEAADTLQHILQGNEVTLDTPVDLETRLVSTYRLSTITRDDTNIVKLLPADALQRAIDTIDVHSAEAYISILRGLPLELYAPLMARLPINLESYGTTFCDALAQGSLSPEQMGAFNTALLSTHEKYANDRASGYAQLICFSIGSKNPAFITMLLEPYAEATRFDFLNTILKPKGRLFSLLPKAPGCLYAVLASLPATHHAQVVEKAKIYHPEEQYNYPMLTAIIRYDDGMLKRMLQLLSKEMQQQAVRIAGPLFTTAIEKSPSSLPTLLAVFPKEERWSFLRTRKEVGQSVLGLMYRHPETLKIVAPVLPPDCAFYFNCMAHLAKLPKPLVALLLLPVVVVGIVPALIVRRHYSHGLFSRRAPEGTTEQPQEPSRDLSPAMAPV